MTHRKSSGVGVPFPELRRWTGSNHRGPTPVALPSNVPFEINADSSRTPPEGRVAQGGTRTSREMFSETVRVASLLNVTL